MRIRPQHSVLIELQQQEKPISVESTSHNLYIALASALAPWATILAFITASEVPLWLYVLTALVVPLVVGLGGKVMDIAWGEYKDRREFRRKMMKLDE